MTKPAKSSMTIAVIDTNVFVSALIGSPTCREIYQLLKEDRFRLIISGELISELKTVLARAKFGLSKGEVAIAILHIRRKAQKVKPSERILLCRDVKDNIVLEAASAARTDFIVTGDKDLLSLKAFRKTLIVTPRKFLNALGYSK